MSATHDDDAVGVDFEPGRRSADGTWSPDWVVLSGASATACKLYQLMRLRLNRKRRDGRVWPSTATLAVMLGMKRPDSVAPYTKELEDLGAITIRGERMPRRNVYIVHDIPEPDYDGPMTLEEWDHDPANRLKIAVIKKAERDKRERARAKTAKPAKTTASAKKPQVSLDTGKNRDQDSGASSQVSADTGSGRYQGTGENRDHGPGENRCHSLIEPLRNEPPTPPTSSQPAASPDPEEEEKIISPSDVQAAKPADAGPQLDDWEQQLHGELMAQRPSWSPSALREVLASSAIRERTDRGLVRRAFLIGARTSKTTTPRRLLHDLCPHWDQALKELREEAIREQGRAAEQDTRTPGRRESMLVGAYRPAPAGGSNGFTKPGDAYQAAKQQLAKPKPTVEKAGPSALDRLRDVTDRMIPSVLAGDQDES